MDAIAAVIREPGGPFRLEPVTLDEPRDDEVLVRLAASGICHTDLVARDGHIPVRLPAVFGHEGAGVVAAIGARVTRVQPGDHVVLGWTWCGECPACRDGAYACCDRFFPINLVNGARPDGSPTIHRDGESIGGHFFAQSSFSTAALAPERSVVKVPADIALDLLAPLGCGVVTGAGTVMNNLRPRPGDSIAIFGVGPVGMSALLAAVVTGCTTIVAIDVKEERLAAARDLGATHVVNAASEDPVAAIRDITGGGPAFSVECVGNPRVLRQAVDVLPRRGVCALVGVVAPGTEVTLDQDVLMNARAVRGVIEGDAVPDLFIPRLIELYRQGRFPFEKLITFYPFAEIERAVHDMEAGVVVKPVLRMETREWR